MNLRKSISGFALIVIVGFLVPGFSASAADLTPPEAGTQFVRVPAAAMADFNRLGLSPRSSQDYDAFYWLELSSGDLSTLSSSAVPFAPFPDAGKVQVNRFRFDPIVEGEPELPADLRASGEGPGFRLIQLAGPAQDTWLAQLEAAGLPLLQYYPHNSYLTWTTAAAAESVAALDFVRWQGAIHPGYKVSDELLKRSGLIRNVDVMFYDDGDVEATAAAIAGLGGEILQVYPAQPDRAFFDAIIQLDASAIEDVARVNTVLWLGYLSPEPILDDEMSSQIVAGNYSGGVPFTGYFDWLDDLGYDGTGVRWAIVDTGVDYDHPDLGPHIAGGYSFPGACDPPGQPGSDCSGGGHGTHVAGIVGGDATAGFTDANGFFYGLGIAPAYDIFAMNSLSAPYWPPSGGWQEHSKQAVLGQAIGGNNSWTTGEGTAHGYQSSERTHDFMVRDGNFDTGDVAEPFIEVFSAGNSGPGAYSLTAPKEAKNLIVTASSINYRVGSIDSISGFSSRGPAVDGRWVPTVAAPGEQIASARNDLGGSCSTAIPGTNNMYAYCSGTSMAAPHVAGSITLITEWWRTFNGGADPSPAMAKALLVNGAVDMNEGNPIPNIHEGWGRVHLTNVMDSEAEVIYYDQTDLFDNTGESWQITVGIPDPAKPFKVSLAWSDAPGAVGANPALVNDLDLIVDHGGDTYLGNNFSAGWSIPGGNADLLNNMENVYIQNPGGGAAITVQASNIAGDGVPIFGDATDQDFALICYNCALQPDFVLEADPSSQDVCAPDDAAYDISVASILGYDDPVAFHTDGEPAGTTVQFSVNPVVPPGATVLTIGDTASATPGSYAIDVVGVAPTSTHTTTVGLNLYDDVPGAITLLSPGDGAMGVPPKPTFEWMAAPQGATYGLQVSTDPAFDTTAVDVTGIPTDNYSLETALDLATCYFWRTAGENACGQGDWTAPFRFATVALGVSFSDDIESGDGLWSHQAAQGTDNWAISTAQSHSPTHAWYVPDDPVVTDSYLWNTDPVAVGPGSTLTFWHRHQFESSYDGAVLEISTDGGGSWTDLGPYITANGYNGSISTCCSNPLGGRQAWVSDQTTWTQVEVDLSSFAGEDVQIRWRIGCDYSVSDVGWYIDDVQITSPLPPNPAPTLLGITPDSGSAYVDTPVQIEGSGFIATPAVKLGDTWLLSVTLVNSTTLDAVVPAGMPGGVYDLTLYNSGDCQEATLADAYTVIVQCISPTVSLESDSPVVLGEPMHFTATLDAGTPPLTYTWDFGGAGYGGGLDTASPVFTYTEPGSFTAVVTAENECGTDSTFQVVEVLCDEPEVLVTNDSPAVLGEPVLFAATVTGTLPFTYTWDFGGAGTGSGLDTASPVFTYTEAGSFTATATVENGCGVDAASTDVEVTPMCTDVIGLALSLGAPGPVYVGEPMDLLADIAPQDAAKPYSYTVDYGDGTAPVTGTQSLDPMALSYSYTSAGTYTVQIGVWNCAMTEPVTGTVEIGVEARPMHYIYLPVVVKD
jgi:PKD repeat protein